MKITLLLLISLTSSCPNQNLCRQCEFKDNKFTGVCLKCSNAYIDKNNKCESKITVRNKNCMEYSLKEIDTSKIPVCSKCEYGFYLHQNNCFPCGIEGCAVCSNSENCSACFKNKLLELEPNLVCSAKDSPIQNCELTQITKQEPTPKCLLCQNEFSISGLDYTKCIKTELKNCGYINSPTENKCIHCNRNYFMTDTSTCLPDVQKKDSWWLFVICTLAVLSVSTIGVGIYEKFIFKEEETEEKIREEVLIH